MPLTKVKYWSSKYLLVFGVFWLLFEPASLCFEKLPDLGWWGFLGFNVLSLVVTALIFCPKKDFSVSLPDSSTKIVISVSDILKQEGSIVIGTSDTFDTELGEIISPNSLQGQFLTRVYQSDRNALDRDISESLKDVKAISDPAKTYGKTDRYPIGTVTCVRRNSNRFFLVAFNRMLADKKRVQTNIHDLWFCLCQCWDVIRENGHYNDIHIPVLSSKFGRSGLSFNVIIQLIITSLIIALRDEGIAPSLTVHVHKTDANKVDFVALRGWFDCLVGKK
jgi:hypothetical protein